MCGVFHIDDSTIANVKSVVQLVDAQVQAAHFQRDIHPTDIVPVMVNENGKLKLSCLRWGYPKLQGSGVIFNARAESVREKKLFSAGIQHHRAVIPASHFYEWNLNREKNTFRRQDGRTMFLAGFFDVMGNEKRFVILTTQANESMKKVHDRMPLVLEAQQLEDWIYREQYTDDILRQVPVLLNRQAEYEQVTLF